MSKVWNILMVLGAMIVFVLSAGAPHGGGS